MAASPSSPRRVPSETAGRRALGVHVQPGQGPGGHAVEGVDLRAEPAQQAEDRAGLGVAAEHRPVDDDERPAAQRLRDRRQRREVEEAERRRDGVRCLGRPVGPATQHALGLVAVPDEHAGIRRLDRVEPELEGRDDAEAAAATAQRPEELGVLRRVGAHVLAVGGDELDRGEAVGGEAEPAGVPADAAAEAVAGDADVGRAAVQRREPVVGGGLGRVHPERAALDAGDAAGRVDGDAAHPLGAHEDDVVEALRDERSGVVAGALRARPAGRLRRRRGRRPGRRTPCGAARRRQGAGRARRSTACVPRRSRGRRGGGPHRRRVRRGSWPVGRWG